MKNSSPSILIIDDDPLQCKILANIFEIKGYTAVTAGTGNMALGRVRQQKFAVALIDLRLDDMSGLELLSAIKSEAPETECILLTGYASQESAIEAVNKGAYSYILKPFDLDQLLLVIQHALEKGLTEEALRKSENIFRSFLEQSEDAIVLSDENGFVTHWSQGAEKLFGYSREESILLPVWDVFHRSIVPENRTPEAYQDTKRAIQDFLHGHVSQSIIKSNELTIMRQDGARLTVETHAFPVYINTGVILGSITRDITERKKAEKTIQHHLLEMEIVYEIGLAIGKLLTPRQIAQKVLDIIAKKLNWPVSVIRMLDPHTHTMPVIWFQQIGLTQDEIEAQIGEYNRPDFISGVGLSAWAIQNNQSLISPDVQHDPRFYPVPASSRSGLYVPIRIDEQAIGSISVESDQPNAFTEQDERLLSIIAGQIAVAFENDRLYQSIVQSAEKLDEANQFIQATIDALTEHICVVDETGAILAVNRAWREFADANPPIPPDYCLGMNYLEVCDRVRGAQEAEACTFAEGIRSIIRGEADHFSMEYPCNSPEEQRWFEGVVARFAGNGPLRLAITHTNITSRKVAELALRDSHTQLEQRVQERTAELSQVNAQLSKAMRARDEFLANMSHELRSPLNSILGISESLEEQIIGPLNEKQQKYIRTVSESGRHLLALINDILDLSKIEAGYMTIMPEKTQADLLFESALRMVNSAAQKKGVVISFQSDGNVHSLHVDERRMKQALVNLLSNAVKFTPPEGKVGLQVNGDAEKGQASLTVWDTGPGIDQADFPRLFQPFVQLDAGLNREYPGTGLGLALVAQITRLHGGRVSVESTIGKGSQFTIVLPWNAKEAAPAPVLDLAEEKIAPQFATKPATILLIEDTDSVLLYMHDYLNHLGFRVIVASDGMTGVAEAKAHHPDLILMDIQIPGINGYEATRQIRQEPRLKDTPIIALTALAMPGDRERCLEVGMNDYISKPISLKLLTQAINHHLGELQ